MASDMKRLIARRAQTPSGIDESRRTAGRLPDVLLNEQVERVAVFSAVGGALWTYGLLVDTVLLPILTSH